MVNKMIWINNNEIVLKEQRITIIKKVFMKKILIVFLVILSSHTFAQSDTIRILAPTGEYSVGTMIFEWTDESRAFKYSNHYGDRRTLIVQIWYPASIDSQSLPAPYSSVSKDYEKVKANSYLRPSFTPSLSEANLILITPGRGTERFLYTTLIEDLASHGFIVASVDLPEIGYTIYQDGLVVKPSSEYQTPPGMMAGPYEKVDSFYEKPTEIGYRDLEFTLSKISELNQSDISQRFTGNINLNSIGIFGHSLGGRIAGEFAARNENVKAYITMEGIPPRKVRYEGKLNIPIAMLCSSGTLPYAYENYKSLIDNRKSSVFMIELIDFGHNSVTDNPYIYPENFKYGIEASKGLDIARNLITSYFETYLKVKNNFSDRLNNSNNLKYKEYK